MTPEEWQRIRSIMETAVELDAPSRARFLDETCADPAIRREVESLIGLHEEAGTDFLNTQVKPSFLFEEEEQVSTRFAPGTRIGAYEILGEIAQGGMGAVYRALRADGQYTQQVALKIVRSGFGAELTAARFRTERQILASLDHPNIAKILDGGTTPDGLPYFVMELIGGLPITEYCDEKKLSVDARLKLFLAVCRAVLYAHQHLVVHRDLKPTNILITVDGVPKLLDFGIAKFLDSNEAPENLTLTAGLWLMTPEYASPEQLRGEVVTTATDVYSLGLVLHELLVGKRAYPLSGRMPHEIAEVVCNFQPQRPSLAIRDSVAVRGPVPSPASGGNICALRDTTRVKLEKRLRGDLDNIVLMALRKEPSRRYASVEQFAEDIRRHLEHVPVAARNDTVWYRASKFVSRHRTAVSASCLIALVMLSGLAVTLYEARIATTQARIAREQRLRSERRFNDVRKLANSLMFEIHDSIRDLPGATPARKLLVERALEYLDSLSQEAKGDVVLQGELAAAYDRVGDILGYNGAANLGDFPGALQSYTKALAIRESAAAASPDDLQLQMDLLSEYFRLSFAQQDAGDHPGALANLQKALPVAQRLAATHSDLKYQDWLAGIYWKTASVLEDEGDNEKALENFRSAIAIREPAAKSPNASPFVRTHLAADYLGLGGALNLAGDASGSLKSLEAGTHLLEELSRVEPTNATLREYLGEAYSSFVAPLERQGNLEEALAQSQKAQKTFEELWSQDPTNALARVNVGLMELNSAQLLTRRGKIEESIPHIRKAVAIFESVPKKNRYEIAGVAEGYSSLARAFVSLADRDRSAAKKTAHLREARPWFQKSLDTWHQNPKAAFPQQHTTSRADFTARDLAKCEDNLAKLEGRRPPASARAAPPR